MNEKSPEKRLLDLIKAKQGRVKSDSRERRPKTPTPSPRPLESPSQIPLEKSSSNFHLLKFFSCLLGVLLLAFFFMDVYLRSDRLSDESLTKAPASRPIAEIVPVVPIVQEGVPVLVEIPEQEAVETPVLKKATKKTTKAEPSTKSVVKPPVSTARVETKESEGTPSITETGAANAKKLIGKTSGPERPKAKPIEAVLPKKQIPSASSPQKKVSVSLNENPKKPTASKRSKIDPPEAFLLLGVITGSYPSVIVENQKTGKNHSLEMGDILKGFKLTHIQKGRATFSSEKETFTLSL